MDRDDPAYAGQAGYTLFLLAIYDPFVLGFMARAVWRSPIPPVVEDYRRHLGRRHLDVGPGTGYSSRRLRRRPGRRSRCSTRTRTSSPAAPAGSRRCARPRSKRT
jgi:hypothetical protein